jgi:hypothetical protein
MYFSLTGIDIEEKMAVSTLSCAVKSDHHAET